MPQPQPKRRHHTVPKFYLDRFASRLPGREHPQLFKALGHLHRELGDGTAYNVAEAARQTTITALTGLRTSLAALLADPPDDLPGRIAHLLPDQEGSDTP